MVVLAEEKLFAILKTWLLSS